MKKAFTMPEVLVALAILGVLASITIPTISAQKANGDKVMFRKAYILTQEKVKEMLNDEVLYPYDTVRFGFKNTDEVKYNGKTYTGSTKFRNIFKSNFKIMKDGIDFKEGSFSSFPNSYKFQTEDGIIWYIPSGNFSSGSITITIDVNGEKKPNCMYNLRTCQKPDQFNLVITNRGDVGPDDDKGREYLNINKVLNKTKSEY